MEVEFRTSRPRTHRPGSVSPQERKFPARLNLVSDDQWALAKRRRGNCEAEAVPVEWLEVNKQFRRNCDYRWLIDNDDTLDGMLIRSDHHPRRALRAGIPVALEIKDSENLEQRWRLLYHETAGLGSPFRIQSVGTNEYLTVDPETRKVTLVGNPPRESWSAYDARSLPSKKAFGGSKVHNSTKPDERLRKLTDRKVGNDTFGTKSWMFGKSVDSDEDRWGDHLSAFDGELAQVFSEMPKSFVHQDLGEYTPYATLLEDATVICEDVDVTLPSGRDSVAIGNIFEALFSKHSDFMQRYQRRRHSVDVTYTPPEPQDERPWFAQADLLCNVQIPVLGMRPYHEMQRFALCDDGETTTLAWQQVGVIKAGWYGPIRSESLYLFTSPTGGSGAVKLKVCGPKPHGRFADKAIEGMEKALADFQATAQEVLSSWRPRSAPWRFKSIKSKIRSSLSSLSLNTDSSGRTSMMRGSARKPATDTPLCCGVFCCGAPRFCVPCRGLFYRMR